MTGKVSQGNTTTIFLRTRNGIKTLIGPPSKLTESNFVLNEIEIFPPIEAERALYSPNGDYLVIVELNKGVTIFDSDSKEIVFSVELSEVQAVSWSPMSTYLLTWQRQMKNEDNSSRNNLKIWRVLSGDCIGSFSRPNFSKAQWPMVQWNFDESISVVFTQNDLRVYQSNLYDQYIGRIDLSKIQSFAVSPGKFEMKVACFVPESNNKPAIARIYQYPDFSQPIASKIVYAADHATLHWSFDGSGLLIHTKTDIDRTGLSYYGTSNIYFLSAHGNFDCNIQLPKEGSIFDAMWSPVANEFIVIGGRSATQTILFNSRCEVVYDFGEAHRNIICWSPHGRFFCLAGFGNLAGEMDFWDRQSLQLLGSNVANCAVGYGWSPDSRYFLTATLAPRMNVDNGVTLYKYDGTGPIANLPTTQTFDAFWRPAPPGTFPSLPPSPRNHNAKAQAKIPVKEVYRPPGKRLGEFSPAPVSPSPAPGGGYSYQRKESKEKQVQLGPKQVMLSNYIPGLTEVNPVKKNKPKKKKNKGQKNDSTTNENKDDENDENKNEKDELKGENKTYELENQAENDKETKDNKPNNGAQPAEKKKKKNKPQKKNKPAGSETKENDGEQQIEQPSVVDSTSDQKL